MKNTYYCILVQVHVSVLSMACREWLSRGSALLRCCYIRTPSRGSSGHSMNGEGRPAVSGGLSASRVFTVCLTSILSHTSIMVYSSTWILGHSHHRHYMYNVNVCNLLSRAPPIILWKQVWQRTVAFLSLVSARNRARTRVRTQAVDQKSLMNYCQRSCARLLAATLTFLNPSHVEPYNTKYHTIRSACTHDTLLLHYSVTAVPTAWIATCCMS